MDGDFSLRARRQGRAQASYDNGYRHGRNNQSPADAIYWNESYRNGYNEGLSDYHNWIDAMEARQQPQELPEDYRF